MTGKKVGQTHRDDLIDDISENTLECPICIEFMIIPMITECGHTYCYSCLYQWLACETKCPLCRKSIYDEPNLNPILRQTSIETFELLLDININDKVEVKYLIDRRDDHTMVYETDFFNGNLFGNLFNSSPSIKSGSPSLNSALIDEATTEYSS
ncbi:hypothetical protein JA1_002157 [Spathaspora sp. JA1]|nr:hypothetical protein JA1_002157 [Spathaspora sp. JA1]